MSNGFKVLEISADDYPSSNIFRIQPMRNGDVLYVFPDENDPVFSAGDIYPKYNKHFVVYKAFYEPKHWWQFWKKKVLVGYVLMYKED